MQKRISLVQAAHELVAARLQPGDIAIDATVGNGHDTLFLLGQVMPGGKVYGFDIQPAALDATAQKADLAGLRAGLTLFHDSHAAMEARIPAAEHGKIAAVMFNLGYLPGSDKTVTTQAESTLAALSSAISLISAVGVITVVAYPGHPGGAEETASVERWRQGLPDDRFNFESVVTDSRSRSAPKLFVLTPRRNEDSA